MKYTQRSKTFQLVKTTLIAAAVSTLFAGQAMAQSNVTIYGRVVAGVDYQTNIANKAGTGSNNLLEEAWNQWGTSFLGFQGTEDLGGGMHATFDLETGFGMNNGVGNGPGIFNRKSYVGLGTNKLGTIQVGQNLTIANGIWDLDPTGQQFMGTETLVRGRSWGGGASNVIEYVSPNWGGFDVYTQFGLSGVAGSTTANQTKGVQLTYTQSNMELRAMYDDRRDANGLFSDLFNYSKEWTFGGTYTIDKLMLLGGYQRISAPDSAVGVADTANFEWLGFRYNITAPLQLIGAAYHVNVNDNGGNASLYTVGVNYSLSKLTLLYASIGTVRNSPTANFSVEATNNNPLQGQNQVGTYFGITKTF